eukprot:CAMPEP_0197433500 /NCGR_PEP_ID=MMETSP1175-20131217/1387_1 /TAXON_ID=1003142 /ORGANISM="Triceratium dubium, Strain CCMP147" /LENGTH=207 /DNA_ID=CAMNT_0042961911 /DNA_START=97 /DNA_END=720 /DNA_ORIENTATION=+
MDSEAKLSRRTNPSLNLLDKAAATAAKKLYVRERSTRRVTFARSSNLRHEYVLHVSEYTAKEKKQKWYNTNELMRFHKELLDSMCSQRQSGLVSLRMNNAWGGHDECGVEGFFSGVLPEEFKGLAELGIKAVLTEQDRQRRVGTHDEAKMSEIAVDHSELAVQSALQIGERIASETRRDRLTKTPIKIDNFSQRHKASCRRSYEMSY